MLTCIYEKLGCCFNMEGSFSFGSVLASYLFEHIASLWPLEVVQDTGLWSPGCGGGKCGCCVLVWGL
jgi:hypothetical protein